MQVERGGKAERQARVEMDLRADGEVDRDVEFAQALDLGQGGHELHAGILKRVRLEQHAVEVDEADVEVGQSKVRGDVLEVLDPLVLAFQVVAVVQDGHAESNFADGLARHQGPVIEEGDDGVFVAEVEAAAAIQDRNDLRANLLIEGYQSKAIPDSLGAGAPVPGGCVRSELLAGPVPGIDHVGAHGLAVFGDESLVGGAIAEAIDLAEGVEFIGIHADDVEYPFIGSVAHDEAVDHVPDFRGKSQEREVRPVSLGALACASFRQRRIPSEHT